MVSIKDDDSENDGTLSGNQTPSSPIEAPVPHPEKVETKPPGTNPPPSFQMWDKAGALAMILNFK